MACRRHAANRCFCGSFPLPLPPQLRRPPPHPAATAAAAASLANSPTSATHGVVDAPLQAGEGADHDDTQGQAAGEERHPAHLLDDLACQRRERVWVDVNVMLRTTKFPQEQPSFLRSRRQQRACKLWQGGRCHPTNGQCRLIKYSSKPA